jgi:hypothetical protein
MSGLRVWDALSVDDRAAIERDDPDIQQRMAKALLPHLRELSE